MIVWHRNRVTLQLRLCSFCARMRNNNNHNPIHEMSLRVFFNKLQQRKDKSLIVTQRGSLLRYRIIKRSYLSYESQYQRLYPTAWSIYGLHRIDLEGLPEIAASNNYGKSWADLFLQFLTHQQFWWHNILIKEYIPSGCSEQLYLILNLVWTGYVC